MKYQGVKESKGKVSTINACMLFLYKGLSVPARKLRLKRADIVRMALERFLKESAINFA